MNSSRRYPHRRLSCVVGAMAAVCLGVAASRAQDAAGEQDVWNKLAPFFQPPATLAQDRGDYRSPLVFDDGRPVQTPEQWQQRRQEILRFWQNALGVWPPLIENPSVVVLQTENREDFVQKKVRLEAAPQLELEGYLLVPPGDRPRPAVLVVYYDAASGAGLNPKSPLRDFGYQLTRRGFVSLSIGWPTQYTERQSPAMQPLSSLAYIAANCYNVLAHLPEVDPERVGVVGHSFGGKWAMFASCLCDKFACAAYSDPGIVFDEKRPNVNYWEPWYIGWEADRKRKPGVPTEDNPRTGPYKMLMETGHDLHELHALMAPRPFLVSGGAEDPPERWKALNHTVAVNRLLGFENRVAMTNRAGHNPTEESNQQLVWFFEHFLKPSGRKVATFSICAVDPESGVCGAAVASMYPSVGRVVPYVRADVGAFCTQHHHVPAWGEPALDRLAAGKSPQAVLAELLAGDDQPGLRQLGIVNMAGRTAQHNPTDAPAGSRYWGAMAGRYYACQGNTLTGHEVIASMARAYEATNGSLADRLLAALAAGDCAGGDHRGRLAAGIRVAKRGVEGYWLELYIDKSDDAVVDLLRRYAELDHAAKGDWRGGRLPFEHPCPDPPAPKAPAEK